MSTPAIASCLSFLLSISLVRAQCDLVALPTDVPNVIGRVRDLVEWDPDGAGPLQPQFVVAGLFSDVMGTPCSNIAARDPVTGAWSTFGAGLSGEVWALAVLSNGELVALGTFLSSGATPIQRLARWDGTAWHEIGGGVGPGADSLAVLPSGELVVGGQHVLAGATTVSGISLWDGVSWSSMGGGATILFSSNPPSVADMMVDFNGDLVVVGQFTSMGGVSAARIARWDHTTWQPYGTGVGVTGALPRAVAQDLTGDVLVGGALGGSSIQRWNGSSWSGMGTLTAEASELVVRSSGEVLAVASGVRRWNGIDWVQLSAGGLQPQFFANRLRELSNGDLFVNGTACLRWDGTRWQHLGPGFDAAVLSVTKLPNGHVLVTGSFLQAGPTLANRMAVWDGLAWSEFGGGANGTIRCAVVMPNGDVVVGGTFSQIGNLATNGFARWNGTVWSAIGGGLDFSSEGVYDLRVLADGSLIAGGSFRWISGSFRQCIARWDGVSWLPLGSGLLNTVYRLLELPNGDLIAIGEFAGTGSILGQIPAPHVARWTGTTWVGLGGGVDAAAFDGAVLPNGDLVVGGLFNTAGGVSCSRVARWNGSTWSPMGTGIGGNNPGFVPGVYNLLALPSGDVFATGSFNVADGSVADRMARWDGATWSQVGTGVLGFPEIRGTMRFGDEIWASGILRVDGLSAVVSRLATPCPASAAAYGGGCAGSAGPVVLTAADGPWIGNTMRTRTTGFAPISAGLALLGTTQTSQPATLAHPAALPGCQILVQPDVSIDLVFPSGGVLNHAIPVPHTSALVGVVGYLQVAHVELNAAVAITAVSTSNGLTLQVGEF